MSDRLAQTPSATLSNSPHFGEGDTNEPGGGLMLWGALTASCALIAALMIGATFGTPRSGPIGHAVAAKAFAGSSRQAEVPAIEAMKIVPADPLRKDLSWSPLTGDGSN